jgi:hypothetical protein
MIVTLRRRIKNPITCHTRNRMLTLRIKAIEVFDKRSYILRSNILKENMHIFRIHYISIQSKIK